MVRCSGCSKASACLGCLMLLGAIAVVAWPTYKLYFRTPREFAIQGSTDFKLNLTKDMSEAECSFLLLRSGKSDEDPCRSLTVEVSPPGIAGLSGLNWTSIDKDACKIDAFYWMENFNPSLQFFGTLVPISTTYTDTTARIGEYHLQSAEPLWVLNECDAPFYLHFPFAAGGVLSVFLIVAVVLCFCAILTCLSALLASCCCTGAPRKW